MNEATRPTSLAQLNALFSRLNPQDVEQFYTMYQRWSLYQHMEAVQQEIDALCAQLGENTVQIERVRPSAIALATLARLQASGVEDVELLDRMLERGEDWLDRTIQHLEYCEQTGLIGGDYEEWCHHALEDAFDWIDTLQSAAIPIPSDSTGVMDITAPVDTVAALSSSNGNEQPPPHLLIEELFLQKLMSEDEEATNTPTDASVNQADEEVFTQSEDTTLKIATVGAPFSTLIHDTNGPQQPPTANGTAPATAPSLPASTPEAEVDALAEPVPTPVFSNATSDGTTTRAPSDATPVADRDTLVTPIADRDTALTATTNASTPPIIHEDIVGEQFIASAPEPNGAAQQLTITGDAAEDTTIPQSTEPTPTAQNGAQQETIIPALTAQNDTQQETVGVHSIAPASPSSETDSQNTVGARFIAPASPSSETDSQNTVGARFIVPASPGGEASPKNKEQTAHRRPGFLRRLLLALWR